MTATVTALVTWPHRRGGQAHCLGRLVRHDPAAPAAVLAELRTNPEGVAVGDDAAAAATAFLAELRRRGERVDPGELVWLLQHGSYSYPDAFGEPETVSRVWLAWDERTGRYTQDAEREELLDADAQRRLLGDLSPVEAAVSELTGPGGR